MNQPTSVQRPPAEHVYADELARLQQFDQAHPEVRIPPGWRLSPHAVEKFVLGDDVLGITRKFIGKPEQVTRIIVSLITNRGAMLVGQPGTAKSWLSELISAAVSGCSTLIVQSGAISHVAQLLYSWNDAVLREKGPVPEALIPGPVYLGMKHGSIVRLEELARSPQTVQDALLSILSERQIAIPELPGEDGVLFARQGFNIIGTSNTLDQGVNRMSAALKRRMNFETIAPIRDVVDEIAIITSEATRLAQQSGVEVTLDAQVIECLVTIFHELREGQTLSGRSTDRLAGSVMSTAEAVSVAHAMCLHSYYYGDATLHLEDLVHFIVGAALKDQPEDVRRLKHYFDTEVANKPGKHWQTVYRSAPFRN